MKTELILLYSNPTDFFEILPLDWQQNIVPYWEDYKTTSKIYVFKEQNKIVAGGIVFDTCPPDMISQQERAQQWFNQGFLYIGFLFVAEHMRHQKLGSLWIQSLKKLMPNQSFWLVIEDENLGKFYEKHEFKIKETISTENGLEWLYTYNWQNK